METASLCLLSPFQILTHFVTSGMIVKRVVSTYIFILIR